MKKEYPSRLFHKTPSWVEDGSVFHIRIRCAAENEIDLTRSATARAMLESAMFYTEEHRWYAHLFLLMPDHLHALISFPKGQAMSRVVSDWKRYHARELGIRWQDNYFDHRIRNTAEYFEKAAYIRRNPVVKGLCAETEDWKWVVRAPDGVGVERGLPPLPEAMAGRPGALKRARSARSTVAVKGDSSRVERDLPPSPEAMAGRPGALRCQDERGGTRPPGTF